MVALLVKNPPAVQENLVLIPGSGRVPEKGIDYPLQYSWTSQMTQTVKNLPAIQETCLDSNPGLGRSSGEGNGYPLQYSCLENSMDRGAWQAAYFMKSQRVGHDSLCDFCFFTLLRHNSLTIKFILLKYTIQLLLVFSKNCSIIS